MRVFETATTELRLMHDASDLMNLEKVSRNYNWAEQKIDQLEKEFSETLPEETMEKLEQLHEYFTTQETIAGEIFYNQGFSDGIRLIMQSLAWEPIRR